MIQPPKIKKNDKVIIVSPAGHIDSGLVEKAASILNEWGLQIEISPNALSQNGRFSGTVSERLFDFQSAMDNPDAKVIFCSRGGYGAVHLLDKLDFSKFRKNPKWLIGFSDITALHALFQSHGYMSIHGPMAKHFAEEGSSDFSVISLKNILEKKPVQYNIPGSDFQELNRAGNARGRLFGGNLAVLCGLLGTKMLKIPRNGIMFIEDIGEEPYKTDRFIHQLKLAGVFDKISGLVVGQFNDYEEDEEMYEPLYQSIETAVREYDFPVCFDFPVGHTQNNHPVIMGKITSLEVNENQIIFKQN